MPVQPGRGSYQGRVLDRAGLPGLTGLRLIEGRPRLHEGLGAAVPGYEFGGVGWVQFIERLSPLKRLAGTKWKSM
jgi:hypothetical protein